MLSGFFRRNLFVPRHTRSSPPSGPSWETPVAAVRAPNPDRAGGSDGVGMRTPIREPGTIAAFICFHPIQPLELQPPPPDSSRRSPDFVRPPVRPPMSARLDSGQGLGAQQ